jgi:hypothetical protein
MSDQPSVPSPRDLLSNFRRNYVNLHDLWKVPGKKVPDGVRLRSPKEAAINEGSLPDGMRVLLREYRKSHPGAKMTVLKYMRVVNGKPETVVEDEQGLPSDEEFVSLSQTVTLNTNDYVRVVTEIVVARIR